MLIVGGYGALHGFAGMDVGSLIAFFFLPAFFFQSLQQLGNLYTQVITAMAGAERVFQLIDMHPEWEDEPSASDLADPRLTKGAHGARVEFQHVSFGYDPGRLVLRDVDLVAEPGQEIALVGHTGSGKSTIVNLIAKFYLATEGKILVDGRDLRAVRSESLRRQLGFVFQTNFLFTGTVQENIRFGRPEATDAEVADAARRLGCLDLFEALPRGLASDVGEAAAGRLSVGQRQLVCALRQGVCSPIPGFLILDEATSAVDPVTEHHLPGGARPPARGADQPGFVVCPPTEHDSEGRPNPRPRGGEHRQMELRNPP